MRTLIVEDVHFLAMILQRFLEPYGECQTADNGESAIQKIAEAYTHQKPFDLICLDILLPKMDGIEVLQKIREFENDFIASDTERTKIVMITTLNDQDTVRKALKAGCDRYITKPFSKEKILEEIRELGLISGDDGKTT